jgi:uncharacterized Zn-finger protein
MKNVASDGATDDDLETESQEQPKEMIQSNSWHCETCNKYFTTKRSLINHEQFVHKKIRPFKCTLCNKKFSQKCNLQVHIRGFHNKERPFKCRLCKRKFTQSSNLIKHLRSVHSKI